MRLPHNSDSAPDATSTFAAWVQYQAGRCRELALELEVAAGHAAMSGLATNTDSLPGMHEAAKLLADRAATIERRCRGELVRRANGAVRS